MRRISGVVVGLATAVVLAVSADAQVGVSFVMSSGERVYGNLVDMGASGLEANVNGQSRRWPLSQVAVIDFTGANTLPGHEVDQAGGEHLLVLRDGQFVKGRLVDVAGTNPKRITFSTGGANRDFNSNEIARIYLARPGSQSGVIGGTPTDNLAPGAGRVRVGGATGWVNTGLSVSQGQTLLFNSSGEVRLSNAMDDVAGPAGSKKGRHAPNSPIPSVLAGALIGRIDNGAPFAIGDQRSIVAPDTGMLFLAVNDDGLGDNVGEFGVDVTAQGRRRR